jgi:hypothetical protein
MEATLAACRLNGARPENPHRRVSWSSKTSRTSGLAREVQLRRQHRLRGRLHFHVNVTGSAWIESRDDSLEGEPSLRVRELVSPEPVSAVVVVTGIVRLPKVQLCADDGLARRGQDASSDRQRGAGDASLEQRRAQRRVRGEIRPFGLRRCWIVITIVARRRGLKTSPGGGGRSVRYAGAARPLVRPGSSFTCSLRLN